MNERQASMPDMTAFVDDWFTWTTTCRAGDEDAVVDRLVSFLNECDTAEAAFDRMMGLVVLAARHTGLMLNRTSGDNGSWGAEWVGPGQPAPTQQLAMQLVLTLANGDREAARDLLMGFVLSTGAQMVSTLGEVFLAVTDIYGRLHRADSLRASRN